MYKYYKVVQNGFIYSVLRSKFNILGAEIDKTEYNEIKHVLKNKPEDTEEYLYLLEDVTLKWTKKEKPKYDNSYEGG